MLLEPHSGTWTCRHTCTCSITWYTHVHTVTLGVVYTYHMHTHMYRLKVIVLSLHVACTCTCMYSMFIVTCMHYAMYTTFPFSHCFPVRQISGSLEYPSRAQYQCILHVCVCHTLTLRSSLTLLEGWACQVGFKDAVLHHLAKLSSILDILAMSPHQLVEVSEISLPYIYIPAYVSVCL